MAKNYESPIKSIGHGTTCRADLDTPEEVWQVILHLTQDVSHRLKVHDLKAKGVQLTVKDHDLAYQQFQMPLQIATQNPLEIAQTAKRLFAKNYDWRSPVRALTVRAINLEPKYTPDQLMLFDDANRRLKMEKLDDTIEHIRSRFGKWSIYSATLLGTVENTNSDHYDIIMPGMMYT